MRRDGDHAKKIMKLKVGGRRVYSRPTRENSLTTREYTVGRLGKRP